MSIEAYNMKVIVSGNIMEFYKYENRVFRGFKSSRNSASRTTRQKRETYYTDKGIEMVVDIETGELIPKALHSRG